MVWTLVLFSTIVQVNALDLNDAESHMRKVEWDAFTGLEYVILVTACPGGKFAVSTKFSAINAGAVVTATSRWRERAKGVDAVNLKCPNLPPESTAADPKFDTVSNLLAKSVLIKRTIVVRRGGR